MLKVIGCLQVGEERIMVEFEGGLTRLFMKETFLERVKNEPFYEGNEEIIHLGYACCTGNF